MKILHCADLHIDSPLRGLTKYEGFPARQVVDATRQAVQNIVDFACDRANGIDVVTVGGDVFDGTWEDADTGLWWNLRLGDLSEAGIEVYVVHGNHDADSKITSRITPPPGVTVFASEAPARVDSATCNLTVHGQSYATAETRTSLGANYLPAVPGRVNLGLLHTSLDGRPGHQPYSPCSASDLLRKGYTLWGLGHVHTREVIEVEGVPFLFPGNTQGRHVRETGEKGANIIAIDGTTVTDVEFVAFDVVRWLRVEVDIAKMTNRDEISERVVEQVGASGAGGRTVATRVELVGSGPLHAEIVDRIEDIKVQLRADLGTAAAGRAALERVVDRTSPLARTGAAPTEAIGALEDLVARAAVDPQLLRDLANEMEGAARLVRPLAGRLKDRERISTLDSTEVVGEALPSALELLKSRLGGN